MAGDGSSGDGEFDRPFKRRLALVAAGIALLASIVHLLDDRASDRAATASRDAQRTASQANAVRVLEALEYGLARGVYREHVEVEELRAQAIHAYFDALRLGRPGTELLAEADRWKEVTDALVPLSPLLRTGPFRNQPGELLAKGEKRVRLAELQRDGRSEVAGFWSAQSDTYGALLTVLAVVGVLLGLAAVTGEGRVASRALEIPAEALTGVCLVAAAVLPIAPPPVTPVAAMRHVAEGDRLQLAAGFAADRRDDQLVAARREYEKAIASRPDYAAAHRGLGELHLLSGAGKFEYRVGTISFARRFGNPDSVAEAVTSLEEAVRLDGTDARTLGNLGVAYVRAGRYDEARRVTTRAIELDRTQPRHWFNMVEISAAVGDEKGARRALASGVRLYQTTPLVQVDPAEITDVLGAIRSGLEAVADRVPDRRGLVSGLQGLLVARERELLNRPPAGGGPASAVARRIQIRFDAPDPRGGPLPYLGADYDYTGAPRGTAMTHLWYFRRDGATPWNGMDDSLRDRYLQSEGPPSGRRSVLGPPRTDRCWRPGEYRLDVYAGRARIGAGTARPPAESLCTLQSG